MSVPQSSSDLEAFSVFVMNPGIFCSMADRTFSSAPRRPRFSPNMANFSVPPSWRSRFFPLNSAKNMITPHSSSMVRRKLPCLPVTKPTHSVGTSHSVRSSSASSSSTCTGPTLCAITHFTYFNVFLLCAEVPVISRTFTPCRSLISRRAPDTLAIFTFVLPPFPNMNAASESQISRVSVPWSSLSRPLDFLSMVSRSKSEASLRTE
mmetsp:Transcript_43930/g.73172  ORF Transcript_43930/g.73172 Transcript_43930/m.73172 type:complete len:207 (-) Transcript_43930:350-970(-)